MATPHDHLNLVPRLAPPRAFPTIKKVEKRPTWRGRSTHLTSEGVTHIDQRSCLCQVLHRLPKSLHDDDNVTVTMICERPMDAAAVLAKKLIEKRQVDAVRLNRLWGEWLVEAAIQNNATFASVELENAALV